jgi:hypothetical protein
MRLGGPVGARDARFFGPCSTQLSTGCVDFPGFIKTGSQLAPIHDVVHRTMSQMADPLRGMGPVAVGCGIAPSKGDPRPVTNAPHGVPLGAFGRVGYPSRPRPLRPKLRPMYGDLT